MTVLVRRGEIATNLNIPPTTVKHYIELGLFKTDSRTSRGQFLFDFEEVSKRYEMISELKKKRLTLEEIKQELDRVFPNEKQGA
jgi:DNA-binding transcriptional MerR regulator